MNIDRSTMQAVTGAASTRGSSKSTSADAPEFSFDTGDAPKANADMRRDVAHAQRGDDTRTPRSLDESAAARDTARAKDSTERRDARRDDDASRASARASAKPHDGPNAAARRASHRGDDTGTSPDASATDASAAPAAATADATTPTTSDTTPPATADSLPDRMLALLTGDWAAAAPTPATATTDAASGVAPPALTAPTTAPSNPALPAVTATAMAPASDGTPGATSTNASSLAAGAAVLQALSMPGADTAALPAAATPASDAFAALAALADGKGERGGIAHSTDSASSATPSIAFNPLMAKGADAPLAAVRDVVVAMPTAAPLALDADFDDGMSQRITWMADQRLEHAEVRVTPDGLGPIDIRLQMDGHRVNAQFHAAHADVRQALEAGMDRLRDLLGRQGMELGQTQVGAGSHQSGDGRSGNGTNTFGTGTELAGDAQPQVTTVRTLRARGLIDEYA